MNSISMTSNLIALIGFAFGIAGVRYTGWSIGLSLIAGIPTGFFCWAIY